MNKAVVVLKSIILMSSLSLAACNGGGSGESVVTSTTAVSTTTSTNTTTPVVKTPPSVNSTAPVNASTGVLTNIVLSITFSVDMDAATINNSNFTLTGANAVSGSIAYDAVNRKATFTPDAALKPNTDYTASVTTSVTDSSGTALATVYQVQFTTETFIRRVSVDSSETEATDSSLISNISADGRYVVFSSAANNLVSDDTNSRDDIFIRDTQTGTTTRLSVSTASVEGNGDSSEPVISGDGRYVVFQSAATNLADNDLNGNSDIFIRDTQSNITSRVSISDSEVEANNNSSSPSISADGRYIAFVSSATNLLATSDTNAKQDVFVRDTQNNTTIRVSVSDSEAQSDNASTLPSISADGRYVAFESTATNLITTDTNAVSDIFVRDTLSGTTIRVSISDSEVQSDKSSTLPSISADGRYVAFESNATNLIAADTNAVSDIFIRDTQAGSTTRVSESSNSTETDDSSFEPRISADGRYVAFQSYATNLITSDTNSWADVFVRDTQANTTIRVSVDKTGAVGTGFGFGANTSIGISSNGRYVVFNSNASNLAPEGDANNSDDVFRVLNATP